MLEMPEIVTIAKQMNQELKGKKIKSGNRGNSPHKFAFYNREPEEYEAILAGKTIGDVTTDGSRSFTSLIPGFILFLGWMGGRILFHQDESTLPEKYQFMIHFEDNTYLTVTIQMWGFIQLLDESEYISRLASGNKGVSTISDEFTYEYFKQSIEDYQEKDKNSIKKFMVGIGNSYMHDILFKAKIHPKRIVADIDEMEIKNLYGAIRETMKKAVELGGRSDERDLYNNPGGYVRILDSKSKGKPCPECGGLIARIQYLGGASYFCPNCQRI